MDGFGAWLVPLMPLLVGAVFVLALLVRLIARKRPLTVAEQLAALRQPYDPVPASDYAPPPDLATPPPDLAPTPASPPD